MEIKPLLIVLTAATTLASINAHASIEVKAKQMMTEKSMIQNVTKVQQACGNEVLETNFDWSAWDSYDFSEARLDEVKTTGWLGSLVDSIYGDMVKMCTTAKHAELYKGEFQKVVKIQFEGQDSIKANKAAFSLADDGTVLNVALNASAAYDSSTLKYLKQAWN